MKIEESGMKVQRCVLHSSTRLLLRSCRWMGLFPMEGLQTNYTDKLKFNLRSIYGFYYVISLSLFITMTVLTFWNTFTTEFSLRSTSPLLLNLLSFFEAIILYLLAQKWPYIIKRTILFEQELAKIRTNSNVTKTCNIIFITFLSLGIIERTFFKSYKIDFVKRCMGVETISSEVIMNQALSSSPLIFACFNYNVATLILSEVIRLQSVFILSAMDITIMVTSYYLSSYFRDINQTIESQKYNKLADWGRIRRYYSKTVAMVKLMDHYLSLAVLLSLVQNLYFICFSLFNVFNLGNASYSFCKNDATKYDALHSLQYYMYHLYSFANLMARSLVTVLMAANVNYDAQTPIVSLGEVHSSVYSIEIERFNRQILYTNTGIGGFFFVVTRPLILGVFATMITYELVLVQFAQTNSVRNHAPYHNASFA